MRIILLFLIPIVTLAQQDVPDEYWIDDSNFESAINTNEAFGDDETKPVVVEFGQSLTNQIVLLSGINYKTFVYYRVNIAEAPEAKKKYRVRMAPTIIIFKGGIKETIFKAGLDLELPADLQEIQEAIKSQYKLLNFSNYDKL